ncbi:MAG: hypothetical protein RLZZ206_465 [Cyanobacteriota bacterium]|jgi:hypothetical protein
MLRIDFLSAWLSQLPKPLRSRVADLWADVPIKVRQWLVEEGDVLPSVTFDADEKVSASTSSVSVEGAEESGNQSSSSTEDDADPETELCAENSEDEAEQDDPADATEEETSNQSSSSTEDDADPETELCADNSEDEPEQDDPADATATTHDPVTGSLVDATTWTTMSRASGLGDRSGCEALREVLFEIKQELVPLAWLTQMFGSSLPDASGVFGNAHELMANPCPLKNLGADQSPLG